MSSNSPHFGWEGRWIGVDKNGKDIIESSLGGPVYKDSGLPVSPTEVYPKPVSEVKFGGGSTTSPDAPDADTGDGILDVLGDIIDFLF